MKPIEDTLEFATEVFILESEDTLYKQSKSTSPIIGAPIEYNFERVKARAERENRILEYVKRTGDVTP